jgi:hypothetical protein
MNWNNPSFVRKVIYLVGIAVLLLPIAALSQPATAGRQGERSAGGKLAQLRAEYRLAQAELGEIDPASETMKLATLGLRGVAVDILWYKAIDYQKKKDFTGLEMTVKQIIRLQPNFLKVWDFQAHNLSYNSSVEFDSYRDRYAWVKKGIDFLILGTHYNRDEPGMLYQLGWYVGHKIGRADESKEFRRMFKTDEDLHTKFRDQGVDVDKGLTGYDSKPDNWLVGKLWFDKAERAAEYKSIRSKSPLIFYNGSPMAAINAAAAMEKDDGIFGQTASAAWLVGQQAWKNFGDRPLMTYLGMALQLNNLEELQSRFNEMQVKLDALAPGAREEIRAANIANLPAREKELWDRPIEKRSSEEQYIFVTILSPKVKATNEDVAARVPREKMSEAREIGDQLLRLGKEIEMTGRYRGTVNFDYWRARCIGEQMPEALAAREQIHKAEEIRVKNTSLNESRELFEKAWDNWEIVYKKHPALFDSIEAQELVDAVEHYADVLGRMEAKFPADFKLKVLLDMTEKGQRLRKRLDTLRAAATEAEKKPEEKRAETGEKPTETKEPAKTETAPKEPSKEPAKEPATAEDAKPAVEKAAADKK